MEILNSTGPLIFSVDDDPDFNFLLKRAIMPMGLDIMSTTSVSEYLQMLERHTPHLCLIDLSIDEPDDGFKLIKKTRELLGTNVPIIVISSTSSLHLVARAIERGANDFIVKPLTRSFLISKLSAYLPGKARQASRMATPLVPATKGDLVVGLDFSITTIDEKGMIISGNHLISAGTSVWIGGPLIAQITDGETRIRLVAHSSSSKADGSYLTRLDFDAEQKALLASVRRWLEKRVGE